MTSAPRFDVAIVLIPRVPGDEIFRLGERVQSSQEPSALTAVEQALDALDRAFHPVDPVKPR